MLDEQLCKLIYLGHDLLIFVSVKWRLKIVVRVKIFYAKINLSRFDNPLKDNVFWLCLVNHTDYSICGQDIRDPLSGHFLQKYPFPYYIADGFLVKLILKYFP